MLRTCSHRIPQGRRILICGRFNSIFTVGTPDGIDANAICCLPASIEYSFASGCYREKLWRLQNVVSCPSRYTEWTVSCVFGFFSWLIEVTSVRMHLSVST
jgi:hypothetical protein